MAHSAGTRDDAVRAVLIKYVERSRDIRRRRYVSAATLAIGAVAGAAAATAASAAIPEFQAPGPSATETTVETDYSASLSLFDDLAREPGFVTGGIRNSPDDLFFYWSGELGTRAQQAVDNARSAGLEVEIIDLVRPPEELQEAALHLVEALQNADIEVWGFGPSSTFDAIELMGPELSVDRALQAQALDIAASTLGDNYRIVFIPNERPLTFPVAPTSTP